VNTAKLEGRSGRGIDQGRWNQGADAGGLERGGDHPNIWDQSSAHQPMTQPLAAARLAALDRPDRPSQMARGLLVGNTLEVAKDHGRPETIGHPVDFFMKNHPQLVVESRESLLS
jgi:hypothetical protein